eukprot:569405-Prorocentrum_minimum.AAC.1
MNNSNRNDNSTWEGVEPPVVDELDGGFLQKGVLDGRLELPGEGVCAELRVPLVPELELAHVPREHIRRCQTVATRKRRVRARERRVSDA